MATSRSLGGTLFTTRSPMRISPDVMFSRPAIIRSRVDLPHPDGPTSTTNSPSRISTDTPCRIWVAPNALRTSRHVTLANSHLPLCIVFLALYTGGGAAPQETSPGED